MKKSALILLVLLIPAFHALSSGISSKEAAQAALRFMSDRFPSINASGEVAARISETFTVNEQGIPLYYIFNLEPEGWIAMAADDALFPVLAYSCEGSYDQGREAPAFTAWMQQYRDQISYAIKENIPAYPKTMAMWNTLTDTKPWTGDRRPGTRYPGSRILSTVGPLITTTWDQSPWYNEMCPADPAGPGGHCVAGCVPVCMAQVMYYFRWPETGTGSYSYNEPNYGILSANFGETTYRWNQMTNSISHSDPAIAELIYHLGVSCDLQYGPAGSGMYNHKAAYSLRTYFKYSPETQYLFRDSTNMNWDSVLIAHLDRRIPMYYAGWSEPNVSGHAFVCDGYQDSSFFHFNFGWGGSNDGYFYTSDLTPGGNNFNLAQEVVINCFPDTVNYTYPVYCSGNEELTGFVGSFEDGSGPIYPYQPTASCTWLIDPQTSTDSISSLLLTFDRFETQPTDILTVYDGGTVNDPVIGVYSGEQFPSDITSSGDKLLVTFEASGLPGVSGFLAHYSSDQPVWCSGTTTIVADTAEVTDGSYQFDYYNNTLCKWKLESSSGNPLTIWFSSFDTEEGHDFLSVYDLESGDTLAIISGDYTGGSLPDSVTSPSGRMFLIFSTNSSITANGWTIFYPKKSSSGIGEQSELQGISLFPNPVRNILNIRFNGMKSSIITAEILSAQGKVLLTEALVVSGQGSQDQLDVSMLRPGLYMVRLTSETGASRTHKLMVR